MTKITFSTSSLRLRLTRTIIEFLLTTSCMMPLVDTVTYFSANRDCESAQAMTPDPYATQHSSNLVCMRTSADSAISVIDFVIIVDAKPCGTRHLLSGSC